MSLRTLVVVFMLLAPVNAQATEITASDIIRGAIDNWRGLSSYSEFSMTIHRPEWERSMRMRAWTAMTSPGTGDSRCRSGGSNRANSSS